jgi:branched-chain amino acid transport system substrate-binding protein
MKRFIGFILLIVVAGCAATQPGTSGEKIRVGAFLSLTGPTQSFGVSSLNSFQLATEEVNRAGGIDGRQVELIPADDHSKTEEVVGVVTKLIEQDKVHALLAEPVSTRAIAAAPVAQSRKVVMISAASVKPELTMQGDYIFRACFISSAEGEAIAKFAVDKLKSKTAAILLDNANDYSVVLAGFFKESFTKLGGKVIDQQNYAASDKDISKQVAAIKSLKPDLIFAPGFYTTAGMVAAEVKKQQTGATLMGSDGWDSPELLKGNTADFEGVYFANHFWVGSDDALAKKFVAEYSAKYGMPPDALAAASYDAARLLFEAIRKAKSTESAAIRDALAQSKDFPGVTGRITLDANRNANVPVYILRIDGGKYSLQH